MPGYEFWQQYLPVICGVSVFVVYLTLHIVFWRKSRCCCGCCSANRREDENNNYLEPPIELSSLPRIVVDNVPEVPPVQASVESPIESLASDFLHVPSQDYKHGTFEYSMQEALRDCGLV